MSCVPGNGFQLCIVDEVIEFLNHFLKDKFIFWQFLNKSGYNRNVLRFVSFGIRHLSRSMSCGILKISGLFPKPRQYVRKELSAESGSPDYFGLNVDMEVSPVTQLFRSKWLNFFFQCATLYMSRKAYFYSNIWISERIWRWRERDDMERWKEKRASQDYYQILNNWNWFMQKETCDTNAFFRMVNSFLGQCV